MKRLSPPYHRAGLWLVAVALAGVAAIFLFADIGAFFRRIQNPALAIELVAALMTGLAAVIAAFFLSIPGRSPAWMVLPLPAFALWLSSSGYSCYRNWLTAGANGWALGESANCFVFILAFSVPLAVTLLLLLRRAAPLAPVRVAALGALGVAALVATALQFFHPLDVTFLDLGVHLGTIGLIVAGASTVEHLRSLRRPA